MPTTRRAKAYTGHSPPELVVELGSSLPWTEAEWSAKAKGRPPAHEPGCKCGCERHPPGRVITGRGDCPNGCKYRDLYWERRMGIDWYCARCLTHSSDADDWKIPIPAAVVIADRRARQARLKEATFAARRFAGRKASKRAASG